MSTLDQSFLKAFSKASGSHLKPYEAPQPAAPDPYAVDHPAAPIPPGMYSEGTMYRLDPPHAASPPMPIAEPSTYNEPSFVGPYYDQGASPMPTDYMGPQYVQGVAPRDHLSVYPVIGGKPESPNDAEALAPADPQRPLMPPEHEPDSDDPAHETIKNAAMEKPSAPLELPNVFEPPAIAPNRQFAPDWEVDRFVWPAICERLLESESRYFRHVGDRLHAATEGDHHVLLVSGSRRGEGRSTLALCLARCASEAGAKVAVLDADVSNPQLGVRLGMETPCSWLQVVAGKAPLNEAAVASIDDDLTLFPLVQDSEQSVEAGDPRLAELIEEISVHYPLVIVDIGPLGSDDSHPFAGGKICPIDAAIVVRDLRFTTEKKAMATARQLQASGIGAVGIAENFNLRDVA